MLRHRHDGAHHMLDDDDGEAAARQLADQRDSLVDLRRIEPRHHLVEQQQPRLRRQRPRHFKPALVDGREIARRRALARRQADEIDGLARLVARAVGLRVAQEGAGHHVVEHGHAAERLRNLKGARKPVRADIMRPQADDLRGRKRTPSRYRAGRNPVMRLKAVVLPAPFGPISASVSFSRTEKLTSCTARRPPKRLLRFVMTSASAMTLRLRRHGGCDGGARRLRRDSP